MIDPISALAIFTATSGGVGFLLWGARNRRVQLMARWAEAARLVHGELKPPHGPFYARKPMCIRTRINGVPVIADSYVVSSGKSTATYTRVTATDPSALAVHVEVRRRTFLTSVVTLLGAQDVDVGRPEMSEHVVKARDESIARAWVSGAVARAIVATEPYTFTLEGRRVSVTRFEMEDDPDRLARAMRAAATFMARSKELREEWSSLASHLAGVVEEDLHLIDRAVEGKITVLRHGVEVAIDFALLDERTITALHAKRSASDSYTIDAELAFEGDSASAPSAEALEKLRACTPMKVMARGAHLTLLLDGLELDKERILTAVEAVCVLATGATIGPYR